MSKCEPVHTFLVFLVFILTLIVPLSIGPVHLLAGESSILTNDLQVMVNGKKIDFDTPPYITGNNRTMVPIRFIARELGATVSWHPHQHKVNILRGDKDIVLVIGNKTVLVNGVNVPIDTKPVIKNNRTMVPLRFLSEAFGVTVGWEGRTSTVTIDLKNTSPGGGAHKKIATITGNMVNIRKGSGLHFEKLATYPQGTELEVLGEGSDREGQKWYKVALPDNKQGWIAGRLVDLAILEKGADRNGTSRDLRKKALVIGNNVNIRSGPSLNYQVISQVKKDTELVVTDQSAEWYKIRYSDLSEGWLHGSLVSIKSFISRGSTGSVDKLPQESVLAGKVIVLDPGHGSLQPGGWSDPGAIGPAGNHEADVNLAITKKTTALLTNMGATVIMTREGDTTHLSLAGRAALAKEFNADIFVSIHANANYNAAIKGSSVYFYAPDWDPHLAPQRAQRKELAQLIQNNMVQYANTRDIGIMERGFKVLRETSMPSVLVETAFLSNPQEEQLLITEAFQNKLANGIARGISSFLQK